MRKHLSVLMLLFAVAVAAVWADAPASGRAGRAELRFLQGMVDHHQMALDMAQDCLNKQVGAELKSLCQAVIDAQSPEIAAMVGWLEAWYAVSYTPMSMLAMMDAPQATGGHSGHTMGAAKASDPAGMMGMFAGFNRLDGIAYEVAWLESMIDHHDDAIHMSERVLTRAEHPELVALAEAIISAQSAEIEMMEAMWVARAQ